MLARQGKELPGSNCIGGCVAAQIRKAFRADPRPSSVPARQGKELTLVVADYGQLELRILAHMADCASMKEAFRLGGDFHSRTALGMYDHIKEAIARGALPAHVLARVSAHGAAWGTCS